MTDPQSVGYEITNRAGSITATISEQGLPLRLHIEQSEMRHGAEVLAQRILGLCRQGAARCGATKREEFIEAGVPLSILDKMGLPTSAQVAEAELEELDDEDDFERGGPTWTMRT